MNIHFFLFMVSPLSSSFCSLAPSQAASGVRTETISSTSIRVVWSLPHSFSYSIHSSSKRDYEGFYLGYRELDQRIPGSSSSVTSVTPTGSTSIHSKEPLHSYSFKTINIPAGDHSREFNTTLNDLKRNTRYGVIVQVFNRKGPGPTSNEVTAFTYEYGKEGGDFNYLLSLAKVVNSWLLTVDYAITFCMINRCSKIGVREGSVSTSSLNYSVMGGGRAWDSRLRIHHNLS
jgi:hypothetical protein